MSLFGFEADNCERGERSDEEDKSAGKDGLGVRFSRIRVGETEDQGYSAVRDDHRHQT